MANNNYRLGPSCPCIDHGTSLYVMDGDTIINRPSNTDFGSSPDMGAFESGFSTMIKSCQNNSPLLFSLQANYPNPFNSSTNIRFDLNQDSQVHLSVLDILGRESAVLMSQYLHTGSYSTVFDAGNLDSGLYFILLQAGRYVQIRKCLLVR